MPNIIRNFRVDPTLWETAKTRASEDERSLTSVITAALTEYVTDEPASPAPAELTVSGSSDLPVAGRDTTWDGQAALDRVFAEATDPDSGDVDTGYVGQAFLWVDGDPTLKGSWSLGYADVIDGALTIVPAGIAAAAARLDQTDIPDDDDEDAVEARLCSVYATVRETYEDWPPCPYEDDDSSTEAEVVPLTAAAKGPTAALIGHGTLSVSEDEVTQAAVQRVRELLSEGAVGVSIGADMDPDSMPDPGLLDQLLAEEDYDELERLLADVPMRLRHVAIVDTAAFSDARMTLSEGDAVDGPITFEGIWTGDMRYFAVGTIVWESTLPIPIIWDRQDGDHTGTVVGYVHSVERVEGETSAGRPRQVQEEALAASAGYLPKYPARYFDDPHLAVATPLTISAPDSNGLRHVFGHIAPHGVCHRSDMGPCFTYPGDVDPAHSGFHTGAAVQLDNGTSIRVGALTLGGSHINPALARQGVQAGEVNSHRDNANTVFAMVRARDDAFGLVVSGIVMPDVSRAQIMRAQSCAPSVELWPSGSGRTLVGAHLVPTPAWPVAASLGSSIELASSDSIVVEPEDFADHAAVMASLGRIEAALAILALDALTDVPEPD